jgi:hypothetical protein
MDQWEGSMTRHDGVATSDRGEAAPERKKEGDDTSWLGANLTEPKIKKIHTIDSTATNRR